MTVFKKTVL